MTTKKRLGDLLTEANLISKSDLDKALRLQVGGNRRLGYLLIKMGLISEEQLHEVLSQQLDLPIVNIENELSNQIKKVLPRYLCLKYSVIPLQYEENNTLRIAMVDPSDAEAVSDIEKYTGKLLRPVLASKSNIAAGIRSHIPWSLKDLFNSQTATKMTAVIAGVALILVVVIANQFYQDRMKSKYGNITRTPQSITYENLELILGFDNEEKITLLGRGAHSSGYYSVTFDDTDSLQAFVESKKDGFSSRQIEWLNWAITNSRNKEN
jgi:hypothetical protein